MAKARNDCPTPTLVGVGFDLLAFESESSLHRHGVDGGPAASLQLRAVACQSCYHRHGVGGELRHGVGGELRHGVGGELRHGVGGELRHGVGGELRHRSTFSLRAPSPLLDCYQFKEIQSLCRFSSSDGNHPIVDPRDSPESISGFAKRRTDFQSVFSRTDWKSIQQRIT